MEFALDVMDTRTASEAGADMTVHTLDGLPLKNSKGELVKLKLLGPDGLRSRELTRQQVRTRIARQSAGEEISFAQEDDEMIELLAELTVGWSGVLDRQGNEIKFTPEAVRAFYRAYPMIRDQVDVFTNRRANFIKASSGQ